MGIFGKSKINAQAVFDTVSAGVDNVFFTNEERSEAELKAADGAAEFHSSTLSEGTVRSKTRRFVALCIIGVYLGVCAAYAVLPFFGVGVQHLQDIMIGSPLAQGFIAVIVFFFGGYYVSQFKKKGSPSRRERKERKEQKGAQNG